MPAAQVQAELLSTYAVELLPKPKLPGLSRFRPGEPMHPAKDGLTLIAIGIFWVIRFVISAVMLLWIAGIVFTVVAVLLGFLVRLWPGGEPVFPVPTPTPVVSVAPPTRMDRAWHRVAPHRGVPLPAPIPALLLRAASGTATSSSCGVRRSARRPVGLRRAGATARQRDGLHARQRCVLARERVVGLLARDP